MLVRPATAFRPPGIGASENAALRVRLEPGKRVRVGGIQMDEKPVRAEVKAQGCTRAVLVGHNPAFDLGFLNAAVARTSFKRNPFHPFSAFDTATLAGLAYGHTVLAQACKLAGIPFSNKEAGLQTAQ